MGVQDMRWLIVFQARLLWVGPGTRLLSLIPDGQLDESFDRPA